MSNAKVIYPLFIKRASLNKKGIDYLSTRLSEKKKEKSKIQYFRLEIFVISSQENFFLDDIYCLRSIFTKLSIAK